MRLPNQPPPAHVVILSLRQRAKDLAFAYQPPPRKSTARSFARVSRAGESAREPPSPQDDNLLEVRARWWQAAGRLEASGLAAPFLLLRCLPYELSSRAQCDRLRPQGSRQGSAESRDLAVRFSARLGNNTRAESSDPSVSWWNVWLGQTGSTRRDRLTGQEKP